MHKFEKRLIRLEAALSEEQLPPEAQGSGMLGLLRLGVPSRAAAEAAPWEEEVDETEEAYEELVGFVRLLWEQQHERSGQRAVDTTPQGAQDARNGNGT